MWVALEMTSSRVLRPPVLIGTGGRKQSSEDSSFFVVSVALRMLRPPVLKGTGVRKQSSEDSSLSVVSVVLRMLRPPVLKGTGVRKQSSEGSLLSVVSVARQPNSLLVEIGRGRRARMSLHTADAASNAVATLSRRVKDLANA